MNALRERQIYAASRHGVAGFDSRTKRQKRQTCNDMRGKQGPLGAMLGFCALALTGCQAQQSTPTTYGTVPSSQPIQLTSTAAQSLVPESASTALAVTPTEKAAIAKAIEHYRINKRHKKGPVVQAEADLDGDGKPEGLAFFTGESWCAPTGCSLTVFRRGRLGYVPVSTTKRVKPPILIGERNSNGWNNIHVKTGGATYGSRFVTLRFSGQGYPGNAITQTPLPADVTPPGRVAIATAQMPQIVVVKAGTNPPAAAANAGSAGQ